MIKISNVLVPNLIIVAYYIMGERALYKSSFSPLLHSEYGRDMWPTSALYNINIFPSLFQYFLLFFLLSSFLHLLPCLL